MDQRRHMSKAVKSGVSGNRGCLYVFLFWQIMDDLDVNFCAHIALGEHLLPDICAGYCYASKHIFGSCHNVHLIFLKLVFV